MTAAADWRALAALLLRLRTEAALAAAFRAPCPLLPGAPSWRSPTHTRED